MYIFNLPIGAKFIFCRLRQKKLQFWPLNELSPQIQISEKIAQTLAATQADLLFNYNAKIGLIFFNTRSNYCTKKTLEQIELVFSFIFNFEHT